MSQACLADVDTEQVLIRNGPAAVLCSHFKHIAKAAYRAPLGGADLTCPKFSAKDVPNSLGPV
jgi:hypothetical protein